MQRSAWRVYSLATAAAILMLADWAIFGTASDPEAVGGVAGVLIAVWICAAIWRKMLRGKNPWSR